MFQTLTFWIALVASVGIFWALPARRRIGFLAVASVGLVAALAPVDAAGLLAWALLFYLLTPRLAPAAVVRNPQLRESDAAQDAAGSSAVGTVLLSAPPQPPRARADAPRPGSSRWLLWLLIAALVAYGVGVKYSLPALLSRLDLRAALRHAPSRPSDFALTLGVGYLSCFTFKFIHYAIEVARGNVRDRSLANLLCYAFLFPIFVMGPIERFDHFLANRDPRFSRAALVEGLTRIVQGLVKWCVLGEILFGEAYHRAVSGEFLHTRLAGAGPLKLWWVAIQVYLYGYMNFAGYSDIAIGASRLFGIRIMENFNWPLLATSPAQFWRRWHMTLAGWCQTYVFMPVLGYTRRPNVATYASFLVIGLWHGVSLPWMLWGLYHGTGVVLAGAWTRHARRKGWAWTRAAAWPVVGAIGTVLFIAAGEMLTFGGARSPSDLARLAAKLAWIPVK